MPDVLIRKVPDSLHRALMKRAARMRRSMNAEILVLLENATVEPERRTPPPPPPAPKA